MVGHAPHFGGHARQLPGLRRGGDVDGHGAQGPGAAQGGASTLYQEHRHCAADGGRAPTQGGPANAVADAKRGGKAPLGRAPAPTSIALHSARAGTGSRPGVLFRLRWDQIDLGRGLLYRRPHGQPESATKRAPPVKLGRKILGHLRRWRKLDRAEWIVHYDGQPIKQFSNSWPTVIERAGLPGVSLHTLRHTRATWTVQAGVPIWEAAGFLGMTPATLSATYGHHSPDFQSRAADI